VGRTKLKYVVSLVDCRQLERFLLTKLSTLDALDIMLLICFVKDIVLSSVLLLVYIFQCVILNSVTCKQRAKGPITLQCDTFLISLASVYTIP